MRSDVAKLIANECKYMKESFWTEFTVRAYKRGFNIAEVPVSHRKRLGDSNSTRVYRFSKIPRIAISQSIALLKLWWELEKKD
jgi:hypothetical protein